MNKHLVANLALISVAIIWGVTFYPVQAAFKTMPVFSFLFFRFALAGLLLLPLLWYYKDRISSSMVFWGSVLGSLFFAAFGTQSISLLYTTSSIVAFITGLYIVMVPILMLILFRENTKAIIWIATFIATFGLWLLVKTDNATSNSIMGDAYALLCALFFALHVIFTQRVTNKFDTILLVSIEIITVAILSFLTSLIFEPTTIPTSFNSTELFAIIITAIFATLYALYIQTHMQKFIPATRLAIIFMLEPVAAAIIGVFWANEILTFKQAFGAILIMLAMLISELYGTNSNK